MVTSEELKYPVDVAVDSMGTIFVADHEAHSLLKWNGLTFETVAQGQGLPRTPLYGIRHIAPRNGSIIASDPATMKLYNITDGKIETIPDDNRFVTPWGIAVEPSGNILAVDRVTRSLRRLNNNNQVEDLSQVRAPRAILFDPNGHIVLLTDSNLMRVSDERKNKLQPIISSPPFQFPHDALLHPDGNYYVTDGYAKTVWKVTVNGKVTAFIQGNPLISPQGLAVDKAGNLLVADAHAKAIFQITPKGKLTRLGQ